MSKGPIAITGMHRSGTSMITRALHDSGLHLIGSGAEDLIDAAEDNPEGFWENKAIVTCNDELLEATGGAWDNPPDLPPLAVDDPRVTHVAEAATSALTALSEHDHWGFKDPRLCLTAGYWLDLAPDLRFILCVRHPLEVALSLKRRNQNSYSLGLALWERYYATVLDLVPADRLIVTHYDTFFVDPDGEIARLCAFAGLDAAPPRVRADLRHHTIGAGLSAAGVSPTLRALYARLCREAGAPVPVEPPSDEGRVRRLILDGAVAQRHADQRQAAIDRLEERHQELRREAAEAQAAHRQQVRDLEAAHRQQVRDLETSLATVREEGVVRAQALEAVVESLARTETAMADIDERTRATAARLEVAITALEPGRMQVLARRSAARIARDGRRLVVQPGRRALRKGRGRARPAASALAQQLPAPTQQALRRGWGLARRGLAEPGPTAKAVRRRLLPWARASARRLPPPAQMRLRRVYRLIDRASTAPVPTAKAVTRRLPPPAQRILGRAWHVATRLQGAMDARATTDDAPKPPPLPKGPAVRHWKDAYTQMVTAAIPDGQPWLAVLPGGSREILDVRTPRGTSFPQTRDGKTFADDLAHIAHLESLRYGGHRHLVLPEGSRPWFKQQAALRDHVVRTYRTVVDDEGAGAVFDLASPAGDDARSLRSEVGRLGAGLAQPPAVLDWTDLGLDVAAELPGLAIFRPPVGERLPYIDHSVDVVVVDDSHDVEEAKRVSMRGVITVTAGASGVEVVRSEGGSNTPAPSRLGVLVWTAPCPDATWETLLGERAASAGATLHVGEIGAERVALGDHDVVVIVEPHVLPLPGSIEAAAVAAAAGTAVAGKVMRPDGRLESAGGTVFSDRSVALIGGSSLDVRAPWHDYVRPVCWAPGLLAVPSSLWRSIPAPSGLSGRSFLREWCALAWAQGASVTYHPTVVGVRVVGDGGEASIPLEDSAWQRVLDLRPARPRDLRDGEWRYLLAHDDVEACRG